MKNIWSRVNSFLEATFKRDRILSPVLQRFSPLKVSKFTFKGSEMKRVQFVNSVDPDEAAHDELPHLDPHVCRHFFECSQFDISWQTFLYKIVDKFCHLHFLSLDQR